MSSDQQVPDGAVADHGAASDAELARQAEALLFSLGTAIEAKRLADALGIDLRRLEPVLDHLARLLADHGLMLQRHDALVQMVTRPEASDAVRRLLNPEVPGRLSPAAYETLAIVAYRQPVTKASIEEVRGVDCERVLEGLLARGLVEERGRLDAPGTPRLFGTTMRFLQLLGVERLEDLPGIPD
ncbi:MAG: SMC-Scp complex subunit ScpB [Candidatus Dormiibacterota bacterium]|jgi:segregation and condensation protein B|nr:SMC-Scp complex subunit ScpB [Candidatus Dormibacteraeota bacterium]